ncbi:HAD family hydrolase [Paenibacillus flagellatus]|uniref:HAD family hydrolase n=1 Tax=Paenibacillus flagellatus TaxID=2211139 RepID=A0A2V5K2C9_9BACL|nr:HAD-IA family hydrolase [Paenibacillus flagellatus]PYI53415.1 hypothetical protein DLM86_16690 [Paenibacillus flagellatus]
MKAAAMERGGKEDGVRRTSCALFDLDETLFDHAYSCRQGIEAMKERYPALRRLPTEELEAIFWRHLNGRYGDVLQGRVGMAQSRLERIALLFEACGVRASRERTEEAAALYVKAYERSARAIPGAAKLLAELRRAGWRAAVVTNGFAAVQAAKLERIGLAGAIDALVASEQAGAAKPDRRIFEAALARCGARADEAVMIGDLWETDIVGAAGAGIRRRIWLNRRGDPVPDPALAETVREPLEVLRLLLS